MSLKDGLELVVAKRPIAEPNPGFIIQLKAFENLLFGKISNVPVFLSKTKKVAEKDTINVEEKTDSDGSVKELKDSMELMELAGDKESVKEI